MLVLPDELANRFQLLSLFPPQATKTQLDEAPLTVGKCVCVCVCVWLTGAAVGVTPHGTGPWRSLGLRHPPCATPWCRHSCCACACGRVRHPEGVQQEAPHKLSKGSTI